MRTRRWSRLAPARGVPDSGFRHDPTHPGPIRRASPILAGLMVVALALGWSVTHPVRSTLELVGGSAIDLGTMPRGSFARHDWEIRNVGAEPLRLRTRF